MLLATALTVTSLAVTPAEAGAAKKKMVSLAKKKITVMVGQTKKIKIVPAKKKAKGKAAAASKAASTKKKIRAKVKWKSSNKNIVKVVKKKVFVKKANARVTGVAPGTAVVKAVYKRKSVKATLKCKVTVIPAGDAAGQTTAPTQGTNVTPTQNPAVNPTDTVAPTDNNDATDAPKGTPTVRPTKAPTDVPTATPTRNPETQPPSSPNPWPENADSYSFDLDAPREQGGIYSVMNSATWESNDDGSVTVTFDSSVNYPDISFRIPDKYYKPGYYKWVEIKYSGNEGNRGLSIYDKGLLPDHDGDPWACDSDTKHDMGPDFLPEYAGDCVKIIALDEIENWTDYATQIDIYAPTVEGGQSAGGKITIKSITLYSDQPGTDVTSSPEPSATPSATEPLGAEADATQIDTDITVDGDIEDVWANVPSLPIANYSSAQGETTATAKLAWKADKLNILVEVKDPSIDATSNNNYEQDGIDVFLDEDNSKEAAWDANTDALQYRYSGFTGNSEAETPAKNRVFDHGGSAELLDQIKSAYKVVDGGYVIETSIPLKEAKAEQQMGFELTVFDCADGKRNNEIWLLNTGNDMTQLWDNHVDWIGTITLKETVDPSIVKRELDLSKTAATYGEGTAKYDEATKSVTGTNVQGLMIPLGETLAEGDTIKVTIYGTAKTEDGDAQIRAWLSTMANTDELSAQVNPAVWETAYEYTAKGPADAVQIKKVAYNSKNFTEITITKVVVESKKKEPVYTPVEPTQSEEIIDGDVEANICADNILDIGYSSDAVKKEFPGDGSVKLDLTNEAAGAGITVFFKDDHSLVDLSKYTEVQIEVADVGQNGGYGPAIEMKDANGTSAVGSPEYWPNLNNGTWTKSLTSGFGNVSGKKAAAIQIKYNTYGSEETSPRATLTIKSVKLIASNPVSSEVQTFEKETSGNVSLDSSTGYGDVRINEEKFQEFLEYYSDVYTAFDKLSGKEAGQYVTKYTADDEEITYTSKGKLEGDGGKATGTLTVKGGSVDRSLDVEITKEGSTFTGKFTDDKGKVREIKVTESAGNVCNITDNGEEGYKLIVEEEADDYTVTYLAPTGDYIKLTKVGNKYTLKATKAMIDKYGLSLSYLEEA